MARFAVPAVKGRGFATLFMASAWFFIEYRIYHDGPHHFLHHHAWHDERVLAHLKQVDERFGSSLATDNMH